MAEGTSLLVEIGTEELPPKALQSLSNAFGEALQRGFAQAGLSVADKHLYATPRRLAVRLTGLADKQQDRVIERKGPALTAAFDEDGNPTKAALGFARSCGIEVDALERLETDKGAWLVFRVTQPGQSLAQLAPVLITAALEKLPVPRQMRWGAHDTEFARPVHWVVLMIDTQVIDATILGIKSCGETRGHRFHHPGTLPISSPQDYAAVLAQQGRVLAEFERRRELIKAQVQHCADDLGGEALIDEELLDEVTALVEWPQAIAGSFEERFLAVPSEVLITTMQDNQKYFAVVDGDGKLLPRFIAVSNIESADPARVREGNERVIRPRFSDAEFFWEQDKKTPLADHREALKGVIYQDRLGSLFDKTERLISLAEWIAPQLGADVARARRAAALSKCDLLSAMVYEFPDLQGIMGCYYARHDGEPEAVALALDEQYMPRQAGDALPQSDIGEALALADRLDTLVGIFAAGHKPSGVKDPFGLRRTALGVLRILIERELDLDLEQGLQLAARQFPKALGADDVVAQVFDYAMDRLRAYYVDQKIPVDVIEAVMARRPTRPLDFDHRVRALERFRQLPEAQSLAAANKRIRNILKQAKGAISTAVDETLMQEPAERELFVALKALAEDVDAAFNDGEYQPALTRLTGLREPVDQFFDDVMVMVEDDALRNNRIALLNQLSEQFLRAADLSKLQ